MKVVSIWFVEFEGKTSCHVVAANPEHAIKVAREGRKSTAKTDASTVVCIAVHIVCLAFQEP